MTGILEWVNGFVWGVPALLLILSVGVYLTIGTGFGQIRLFPAAVKTFLGSMKSGEKKEKSAFRALCTALAATVGTGNIAGVAGAIAIGGPGSIFWMWVCAVLGMVTKCAEAALSVRYRIKAPSGEFVGGPMYMIERGMGKRWRPLAVAYSLFGVVAAFGMGNATQINAVIDSVNYVQETAGCEASLAANLLVGTALAILTAICLIGGAKRIGDIAVFLVPFASAAYICLCLGALVCNAARIGEAFGAIVCGAFSPRAVTGGVIGSGITALRVGASRGTFTNEAGMGTAAIAHGESQVCQPIQQGLMGIMEVFLDTVVICTLTALVILTSGVTVPYGCDEGVQLTTRAFACTYGQGVGIPMAVFLCCFAFATMLGWSLYGLRCAQYLFGEKAWKPFIALQFAASLASVLLNTGTVWMLSEIVNGLMAIPNLIALAAMSPAFFRMVEAERKKERRNGALRKISYYQGGTVQSKEQT